MSSKQWDTACIVCWKRVRRQHDDIKFHRSIISSNKRAEEKITTRIIEESYTGVMNVQRAPAIAIASSAVVGRAVPMGGTAAANAAVVEAATAINTIVLPRADCHRLRISGLPGKR